MDIITVTLLGIAATLLWGSIKNVNPIDVIRDTLTGGAPPTPGSWGPMAGAAGAGTDPTMYGGLSGDVAQASNGNPSSLTRLVRPAPGAITARFGQSGSMWSSGSHDGLDIDGVTGDPIKAAGAGTVVFYGYNGSYGNMMKVRHFGSKGFETWYCHLNGAVARTGSDVSAGQVIAKMGATGNVTGDHLHFMVVINGAKKNPEDYL